MRKSRNSFCRLVSAILLQLLANKRGKSTTKVGGSVFVRVEAPYNTGNSMAAPQPFDPGFTRQYEGNLRRAINKDGSFNVLRRGMKWYEENFYLKLINMRWPYFFA